MTRRYPRCRTAHQPPEFNSRGGSRPWRRMVARVVAEEPLCRLRLDGCTLFSTTANHIIPRKYRPDLTMERWNLQGSCRSCNMKLGARVPTARQVAALRRAPARALLEVFGR